MRNISYAMPIVLIGASGLILISRGMHNSWGLFLIPLTDHLNVGREIYSIGISLNVLFSGLGAPLFGALADKYGPGKSILLDALDALFGGSQSLRLVRLLRPGAKFGHIEACFSINDSIS